MTADRLATLLRSADPRPRGGLPEGEVRTPESEALLQRILAGTGHEPTAHHVPDRHGRRRVIGLLAVAVVLAALAVPAAQLLGPWLPGGGSAQAATPTPLVYADPVRAGAAAELRAIADRVQDLPDDVGTGDDVEVAYRGWSLFTRVDGVDVTSRVVPQRITKLTDAAGTTTVTTVTEAGDETVEDTVETARDPLVRLPVTDDAMAEVLASNNGTPAGRFDAVVSTLLEQPAGPGARAAMLRYLADTRGIAGVGGLEDRLGREGVGFVVESAASGLPTRYLVVVDPRDGRILGYEEMLTEDPGRLEVPIPSVISYVAWESARYVD